MALFDTGRGDITLIVKDTGRGAANAAQSAIDEGAEMSSAGLRRRGRLGAGRRGGGRAGHHLLVRHLGGGRRRLYASFPPEEEIRTIVNYAAGRGMGLFAVMSPGGAMAGAPPAPSPAT
ncbi:MAG: hypothetical protein U1F24_13240 [Alphaproteobacteria bacterium]